MPHFQFELWRLFVSAVLVGLAMLCFLQLWQGVDMQPHWMLLGILLTGAAIGVPLKQIVFCMFYLPIWVGLIIIAGSLVYAWL